MQKHVSLLHAIILLVSVGVIFSLGLILVFDTSSAEVLNLSLSINTHQALVKQLIYGMIGVGGAFAISLIGYQNLLRLSFPLLCIITLLLIMTFIPGVGQIRNGARRWVGIGPYTLQPSEFVKFLIPLYYISVVIKEQKGNLPFKTYFKALMICAFPTFLVFLEPDNGTTGIIIITLIAVFFLTRLRLSYWLGPLCIVMILCGIASYQLPYVSGRLHVYLNPEADLLGRGHQPYQAKIAAGSGELLGKGVGQSLQKLNYLPEAQNDYIAAIFAEEFGFIGISILITLYMLLVYCGYVIASQASNKSGFYLAMVLTFLIAFQAFLNLGVVSGLLPSTGLNLPFFSQGGSSLMAHFMAIGLLIKIARERNNDYTCH
jgi:cell division protein FtsW